MALVINFGCRLNSCESDIIQEFANAVVADNNSDGVAEAIYQYL